MKKLIKNAAKLAGYRITKYRPLCRFDAMYEVLSMIRDRGYQPPVIIDVGANVGDWTRMAFSIWPKSKYYAIEPQPACHPLLESLKTLLPEINICRTAVTKPGLNQVLMIGDEQSICTGTFVSYVSGRKSDPAQSPHKTFYVPATTLDRLVSEIISKTDGILLKLDIERHELDALKGAELLLKKTEIVLSEVEFMGEGMESPTFDRVSSFLQERNFTLYDIAALHTRPRDHRLRMGDVCFVNRSSRLFVDNQWD